MTISYTRLVLAVIFIASSSILLLSCGKSTEQTTEQQGIQKDSVISSTEPIVSTNHSQLLTTIIGRQGGIFRGFQLGDPVSKIKTEETFELFEDTTNHVGFTYETENFEAIDVLYYLDKNKNLSGVKIDVYLNDSTAVKSLLEQFDTYLSGKYTPDKKTNTDKTRSWKGKGGILVRLEDVSKGKDFGLRLSIGPKGNPAMAI